MYLNEQDYFYPASTIKMPMAALALEKANQMGVDPSWNIEFDWAREPQTPFLTDSTAADLRPSIAQFVKNIFLYSDNNANNRLYEFLGQDYIHEQLGQKGLNETQLLHRVGIGGFSLEDNKYTNPVIIYDSDGKIAHDLPEQNATLTHEQSMRNLIRGRGYIDSNDSLIYEPFDFSGKNYFPLREQLGTLKRILFPEVYSEDERFNLQEDDYKLLYKAMGMRPSESRSPTLDKSEYYDSYVKFLMFGDKKEPIPEHIRIFNKVGYAYGFLTDVAYIVDFENNVEFLLAATVHVNENSIYNDGEYEYEEVGFPYLGELGRAVYNHELNREKTHTPNLDKYNVEFKDEQ